MPSSHLNFARHWVQRHGTLHVIIPLFNPLRFVSRYVLLEDFIKRATDAGAQVWLAEAAFGVRPFEHATKPGCGEGPVHHVQFRIRDELWCKEDMINNTVTRLPADWEYVAWIDADIQFMNPDWVQETIQQLQHYAVVQVFEHAFDLCPNGLPLGKTFCGFPASRVKGLANEDGGYYSKRGYFHPGYGWACTRDAWDTMGGLLDFNIVGGADHQMAHALYGNVQIAIPEKSTESYNRHVLAWEKRALQLRHNVGFVPGTIAHYWHGKKSRRGYWDRWRILVDNGFDPLTDLQRSACGLNQLSGSKPKLRDALRTYFRSRQEDGIDV